MLICWKLLPKLLLRALTWDLDRRASIELIRTMKDCWRIVQEPMNGTANELPTCGRIAASASMWRTKEKDGAIEPSARPGTGSADWRREAGVLSRD